MKIVKRIFLLVFLSLSIAALFGPAAANRDAEFAEAQEGAADGTFTKTYIISAYYSPLPCQDRYATGNYWSDIRLNGRGTNGADGTEVYLGMIAAPRNHAFGTKMYIPGFGIGAVHDRGGAIVNANVRGNAHDRLDIWMGWGDEGLTRALKWGKRTVDVTVYGLTDSVVESVDLPGFSLAESVPGECDEPNANLAVPPKVTAKPDSSVSPVTVVAKDIKSLSSDLKFGDSGTHVRELQKELHKLNYFKTSFTGYYGEVTQNAVYKFQQSQGLVGDKESPGAGVFGTKTREALSRIIDTRNYSRTLIAEASNETTVVAAAPPVGKEEESSQEILIASEMDFGLVAPSVAELQSFLRDQGFFEGAFVTEYFGALTREAVLKFQLEHGIVENADDTGAGRVGPSTMKKINELS